MFKANRQELKRIRFQNFVKNEWHSQMAFGRLDRNFPKSGDADKSPIVYI